MADQTNSPFHQMPPEMIAGILEYADTQDLVNLSQVCKKFNALAKFEEFKRCVNLGVINDNFPIRYTTREKLEHLSPRYLNALLVDGHFMNDILPLCKSVEHLSLYCHRDRIDEETIIDIQRSMLPNLTKLTLLNAKDLELLDRARFYDLCPNLRHVEVIMPPNVIDRINERIGTLPKTLTELSTRFEHTGKIQDLVLPFPDLKKWSFHYDGYCNFDTQVTVPLEIQPQIENIDMGAIQCTLFQAKDITFLKTKCPKLTDLTLQGYFFSDALLESIAESFPRLRRLTFKYFWGIAASEHLESFARTNFKMKISLYNCNGMLPDMYSGIDNIEVLGRASVEDKLPCDFQGHYKHFDLISPEWQDDNLKYWGRDYMVRVLEKEYYKRCVPYTPTPRVRE